MKKVVMICSVLVALLVVELLREQVVYSTYTKRLEKAHATVYAGMQEEQVLSALVEPDWVKQNELGDTWYWDAATRQGYVFNKLKLVTQKGHYDLAISFNNKRVIRIWGGRKLNGA